jgi:hypothetical protein
MHSDDSFLNGSNCSPRVKYLENSHCREINLKPCFAPVVLINAKGASVWLQRMVVWKK